MIVMIPTVAKMIIAHSSTAALENFVKNNLRKFNPFNRNSLKSNMN